MANNVIFLIYILANKQICEKCSFLEERMLVLYPHPLPIPIRRKPKLNSDIAFTQTRKWNLRKRMTTTTTMMETICIQVSLRLKNAVDLKSSWRYFSLLKWLLNIWLQGTEL